MFFILQCIYLMLPGILANSAPVLFKNSFKSLDVPVDFGKKWRGKEIFGSHKTYRGFAVGITSAIIVAYVQFSLYDFDFFRKLSFYDFSNGFLLFGFLIGFGALFGDLIKSFFKRRVGIKPGNTWFPFDQLDALIGALIFMIPLYVPELKIILTLTIFTLLIHIGSNHIAYWLGMKETKW